MKLPSKRKIRRIRRRAILSAYRDLKKAVRYGYSLGHDGLLVDIERGWNSSEHNRIAARLICFKDRRFKIEYSVDNHFIYELTWKK